MDTDRSGNRSTTVTAGISRRAALGRLAGGGVAATLLAAAWPAEARAQTSPASRRQVGEEANHFVLGGGETQITYDADAFAGEPQLTYRGPIGLGAGEERTIDSRTFVGDEIRTEGSTLGRLVTVVLEAFPDAAVLELTLLLPEINLAADGAPTTFATLAILTTHLTTIGGPDLIEGALQEYEVVALEGTAELIVS